MKKHYAVRYGHEPGVYDCHEKAQEQLKGYSGGVMKTFKSQKEAKQFVQNGQGKENTARRRRFYAVTRGWNVGVYESAKEACEQTTGYSGAEMKAFKTKKEATNYFHLERIRIRREERERKKNPKIDLTKPIEYFINNEAFRHDKDHIDHVFVDGAFNEKTRRYGFGAVMFSRKGIHVLKGSGKDTRFNLGSLSGELSATTEAIKLAAELGLNDIRILYDCQAIEMLANKAPQKHEYHHRYKKFIEESQKSLAIVFEKVPAHAGIAGNEAADLLAKRAAGCHLTKWQEDYLATLDSFARQ